VKFNLFFKGEGGKKPGIIVLCFLLLFFSISSISSYDFNGEEYDFFEVEPAGITFDNNTGNVNNSVNSQIWETNLGSLDNANATQFSNSGGFLNIIESWVDSLWCRLTSCTMTGPLKIESTLNVTGDITTGGYFLGQPLIGSLDPGIIQSDEISLSGTLNLTHTAGTLDITFPNFKARLVSDTGVESYCDISGDTVTIPDNAHTAYFLDTSCTLQNTAIENFISGAINAAGNIPIFHAQAQSGKIRIHQGLPIMNRVYIKNRLLNFQTINLDTVEGLGLVKENGLNFTINFGKYVLVDEVVSSTTQSITNGSGLTIFYREGGSYQYDLSTNGMNLSSCEDASQNVITCSNVNKYRRYYIFLYGYSNGDDDTALGQRLASEEETYNTVADCLNTEVNPITYDIPDIFKYIAVPMHAYCGQASNDEFDGAFIDLRTVQTGSAGSSIDTSVFLTIDGSRPLINNWDVGAFNISTSANILINDYQSEEHNLRRDLTESDNLYRETSLGNIVVTETASVVTVNNTENSPFQVNIGGVNYLFPDSSETVGINNGNNYLAFIVSGGQIELNNSATPFTVSNAPVGVIIEAAADNYLYAVSPHINSRFISKVNDKADNNFEQYISGFSIDAGSTQINFTSGDYWVSLNEHDSTNELDSITDAFYLVKDDESFVPCVNLGCFTEYNDGTAIPAGAYFNVIWTVVPDSTNTSRLVAIPQNEPTATYVSAAEAETDQYKTISFTINDDNVNKYKLVLARTIVYQSTSSLEQFNSGFYYEAQIGLTPAGAAAGGTSDHSLLSKLAWSRAGHTLDSDLVPVSDGFASLGTGDTRWNNLYLRGNLSGGNITSGSAKISMLGAEGQYGVTVTQATPGQHGMNITGGAGGGGGFVAFGAKGGSNFESAGDGGDSDFDFTGGAGGDLIKRTGSGGDTPDFNNGAKGGIYNLTLGGGGDSIGGGDGGDAGYFQVYGGTGGEGATGGAGSDIILSPGAGGGISGRDGYLLLAPNQGNVGIGTNAPTHLLNLVGTLNVTGNSIFESNVIINILNVTGSSVMGDVDFNDGWANGGASIIGGDGYFQTMYVVNITGLGVSSLNINGSLYPPQGFDDTFEIGNESLRWNRGVFGTGDSSFAGSVGIGTVSPGETLVLQTNAGYMEFNQGADTGYNGIKFSEAGTFKGIIQYFGGDYTTAARRNNMELITSDGDIIMQRDGAHNVGIGTDTPGSKLHVVGNASITDDLYIGDRLYMSTDYIYTAPDKGIYLLTASGAWGQVKANVTGAYFGTTNDLSVFVDGSNGRVGIGTHNPQSQVQIRKDVAGGVGATLNLNNYDSGGGTGTQQEILFAGGLGGAKSTGRYFAIRSNATGAYGRTPDLIFATESNNDDERTIMILKNVGDVGIGTTTPGAGATGGEAKLEVYGTTATDSRLLVVSENNDADNTNTPQVRLVHRDSSGNTASGTYLGGYLFSGTDPNSDGLGGGMYAIADGEWGSGGDNSDSPTGLSFAVSPDGSATPIQAMWIDPTGNIGIGTTTPEELLTLKVDSPSTTALQINNSFGCASVKFNIDSGNNGGFSLRNTACDTTISFRADGGDNYVPGDMDTGFGIGRTGVTNGVMLEIGVTNTNTGAMKINSNATTNAIQIDGGGGDFIITTGGNANDGHIRFPRNGVFYYGDTIASGAIIWKNGSEVNTMVLQASGNLGIGPDTTPYDALLDVQGTLHTDGQVGIGNTNFESFASANIVSGDGSGDDIGMTIYSGTTGSGIIRFADGVTGNEQYRGQLKYNQAGDTFNFYTAGSGTLKYSMNTSMFYSSGNIGLGTTAPTHQLSIEGTTGAMLNISGTLGEIYTSTGARQLILTGVPRGTDFTHAPLVINPSNRGDANRKLLGIGVEDVAKFSVDVEGDAYFAGEVGIGTDAPGTALTVQNDGPTSQLIQLWNDNDDAMRYSEIVFQTSGGVASSGIRGIGVTPAANHDSELHFFTAKGGADKNVHMVLNEDGYLGVGVINPLSVLDVYGSVNLTSNISTSLAGIANGGNFQLVDAIANVQSGYPILSSGSFASTTTHFESFMHPTPATSTRGGGGLIKTGDGAIGGNLNITLGICNTPGCTTNGTITIDKDGTSYTSFTGTCADGTDLQVIAGIIVGCS